MLAGALGAAALLVLASRPRRGRARLSSGLPAAPTAPGRQAPVAAPAPRTSSVEDVLAQVELVAAQVRAGAAPLAAWQAAGQVLGLSTAARTDPLDWWAALARSGGDPAASVAAAASSAAWCLAERTGAPLAEVLDGVAAAVRDELAVAGQIEVALAGPRATVRLLTWLPIGGLLLGQAVGASPLVVLLRTTVGRACAALGMALLLAGRWWMHRLVARVEATR